MIIIKNNNDFLKNKSFIQSKILDGVILEKNKLEFDTLGNLIKCIDIMFGEDLIIKYEYDIKLNKRTHVYNYIKNDLLFKTEYKYDESGFIKNVIYEHIHQNIIYNFPMKKSLNENIYTGESFEKKITIEYLPNSNSIFKFTTSSDFDNLYMTSVFNTDNQIIYTISNIYNKREMINYKYNKNSLLSSKERLMNNKSEYIYTYKYEEIN